MLYRLTVALALLSVPAAAQTSPSFAGASSGNYAPLTANALNGTFASKADVSGTARGATAARDIRDRHADALSPEDFGAKGDCAANDSPAISAAIAALNTRGGGALTFGPKCYLAAGAWTAPTKPIRITGAGWSENGAGQGGTWIKISGTTFSLLTITNLDARGSELSNIAFTQTHPTPGSGWAPTVYAPIVKLGNAPGTGLYGAATFRNLLFKPVYAFLDSYGAGRVVLDGIYGQFFGYLARIDQQLDVTHLPGPVHAWTYWSADDSVVQWQQVNSDVFVLRRVDSFTAADIFAYGVRSVLRLEASAADSSWPGGIMRNFQIANLYADATKWAVWSTAGTASRLHAAVDYIPGGQIGNFTAQGQAWGLATPIPGSAAIMAEGPIQIDAGNCLFERFEDNVVRVTTTQGTPAPSMIRCGSAAFNDYNTRSNGSYAVSIAGTASGLPHRFEIGTRPLLTNSRNSPGVVDPSTNVLASVPGDDVQVAVGTAADLAGATTSMANSRPTLILEPTTGTLVSHTVNLPPNPYNGARACISSTQNVATMTVNGGYAYVVGAPAGLTGSQGICFRYHAASITWLRVQ